MSLKDISIFIHNRKRTSRDNENELVVNLYCSVFIQPPKQHEKENGENEQGLPIICVREGLLTTPE